jgi:hypothetical protein
MTTLTNVKAVRIEEEDGYLVAYIDLENGYSLPPLRVHPSETPAWRRQIDNGIFANFPGFTPKPPLEQK